MTCAGDSKRHQRVGKTQMKRALALACAHTRTQTRAQTRRHAMFPLRTNAPMNEIKTCATTIAPTMHARRSPAHAWGAVAVMLAVVVCELS
jgi:hypothetical protein